jgi:hypothetical protein
MTPERKAGLREMRAWPRPWRVDGLDVVADNLAYPGEVPVLAEFTDEQDARLAVEAVNALPDLLNDLDAAECEVLSLRRPPCLSCDVGASGATCTCLDADRGVRAERDALRAEVEALRSAASTLLDKMAAVHVHYAYYAVWARAQATLGPYRGPTYTAEMEDLRAALDRAKGGP